MTFEEMRQAAQEFHTRGDAIGMYRYLRERIDRAADPYEEGSGRLLLADMLIGWRLGSQATIRSELARARFLFRSSPEELADCVFIHLAWRASENDLAGVQKHLSVYNRLCDRYPELPGVQRWRGRIHHWLGHLTLAQGNVKGAIEEYERSIREFTRYEPDPESREQLIRMSKLRLARFALPMGELEKARRYLDDCDGSTISRLWETMRACAEVEYAILVNNAERVRFWMRLAQSWATAQSEATTVLALTQAKVAYANGELAKARLLTLEARRLAAELKQDHLLTEVREFFRLQTTGAGAGMLTQGGIPRDQAHAPLAAAVSGSAHDRRRRR